MRPYDRAACLQDVRRVLSGGGRCLIIEWAERGGYTDGEAGYVGLPRHEAVKHTIGEYWECCFRSGPSTRSIGDPAAPSRRCKPKGSNRSGDSPSATD